MKRDDLQKILRDYMEEHGAMEFLWTVDDELFRPTIYRNQYQIILPTGDFKGNFDYGRGLMVVYIRASTDWQNKDLHCVDMPILNVDDGIWRAVSKNFPTRKEAQDLADKVNDAFVDRFGNYGLPTEEVLLEFLRPFGMYGEYEG